MKKMVEQKLWNCNDIENIFMVFFVNWIKSKIKKKVIIYVRPWDPIQIHAKMTRPMKAKLTIPKILSG